MRKLNLILTLAVLGITLAGSYAQAAPGSLYFAPTGHSLRGTFLSYWQQYGGLERFGYPLSEEMSEVSTLNGKSYTVQYFERAEFEAHPENAAPYDVLLAQLGAIRYRQKYPAGAPGQSPSSDRPTFFPASGKAVGLRFYTYWQTHGGLASFGYPISDEFIEVSELDSQPYLVQYFERAVFEYHPANQPTYDTELSQLGRFAYVARYNPPPPTPRGVTVGPPQLITSDVTGDVAANDRYVFWMGTHDPVRRPDGTLYDNSIYSYNLDSQQRLLVTNDFGWKVGLQADNKRLIWARVGHGIGIYEYYISTHAVGLVSEAAINWKGGTLDDGVIYYGKNDQTHHGIYALDLPTAQERLVSTTTLSNSVGPLVASGGWLLWSDADDSTTPTTYRLHLLGVNNGADVMIATSPVGFLSYAMSAGHIVWSEMPLGISDRRAYLYDISSGSRQAISKGDARNLVIKGNLVAWTEGPSGQGGGWSVQGYDIVSGSQFTIVPDGQPQVKVRAIVGQSMVAYTIDNPLPPPPTDPNMQSDPATSNLYLVNVNLPPTSLPPPPAPAALPIPYQEGHYQFTPAGADDYLVWVDNQPKQGEPPPLQDVIALQLATNKVITASRTSGYYLYPAVDGALAVWYSCEQALDIHASCSVVGTDLSSRQPLTIATGLNYIDAINSAAAVHGRAVAWVQSDYQGTRLLLKDVDRDAVTQIAFFGVGDGTAIEHPLLSGDYIVWSEFFNPKDARGQLGPFTQRIMARSLKDGTVKTVATTNDAIANAALDGHRLVYGVENLYLADLDSDSSPVLLVKLVGGGYRVKLRGDVVVWAVYTNSSISGIWGLKLGSDTPLLLVRFPDTRQSDAVIAADWLVWQDDGRLKSVSLSQAFAAAQP